MATSPVTATILFLIIFLCAAQNLRDEMSCETRDGVPGVCQSMNTCPEVKAAMRKGILPKLCFFRWFNPAVCCPAATTVPKVGAPTTNATQTGRKSEQMCNHYGKSVWEVRQPEILLPNDTPVNRSLCGIPRAKTFVIEGVKARPMEFPHMAAVGFGPRETVRWLCGGTLISEHYVLTAAHCVEDFTFGGAGKARWVRLGDLNLNLTTEDARPQAFTVVERVAHPGYVYPVKYDDIGLLRLDRDAVFDAYVRPACLHCDKDVSVNSAVATGWGRTDSHGPYSNDLLKVEISLVPNEQCRKRFSQLNTTSFKNVLGQGILEESMICAGGDVGGKDTCQGDSGGPLMILRQQPYCMYSIIGVTSFGKNCAEPGWPSVYTRVSHYVPWVESVVWPRVPL